MTVPDAAALAVAQRMLASDGLSTYLETHVKGEISATSLATALASLEDEDQTILTSHFAEGLSEQRIAHIMGRRKVHDTLLRVQLRLSLLIAEPDEWTGLRWSCREKLRAQGILGPDMLTMDRFLAVLNASGWGEVSSAVLGAWLAAHHHQPLAVMLPLHAIRSVDRYKIQPLLDDEPAG